VDSNNKSAQTTPVSAQAHVGDRIDVCVDAMGGDDAPSVVLEAIRQLCASTSDLDQQIKITLTGSAHDIEPIAARYPERVSAVPTTQVITMDEHPAHAVKQKRDSSIVVGCKLLSDGRADAFFSAGSTGAVMTAATLQIGRIRGIKRPAIATVIPALAGPVVLLDVGANADVEPEYLLQFAKMGSIYAHKVLAVAQPRIGLLNVGSEPSKGSRLVQAAYALIEQEVAGFIGNVEGNDIFSGRVDVIVADGFTGNIALKAMEGTVGTLFSELKRVFMSSPTNKLAAALIKRDLAVLKDHLDIEVIGGAPLLGLRHAVVIGHGSSSAFAILNGIRQTARASLSRLPQLIEEALFV
jgi:glycerol-3-phosphate acyltransferase PlsX